MALTTLSAERPAKCQATDAYYMYTKWEINTKVLDIINYKPGGNAIAGTPNCTKPKGEECQPSACANGWRWTKSVHWSPRTMMIGQLRQVLTRASSTCLACWNARSIAGIVVRVEVCFNDPAEVCGLKPPLVANIMQLLDDVGEFSVIRF